jgi:hypothetical protein
VFDSRASERHILRQSSQYSDCMGMVDTSGNAPPPLNQLDMRCKLQKKYGEGLSSWVDILGGRIFCGITLEQCSSEASRIDNRHCSHRHLQPASQLQPHNSATSANSTTTNHKPHDRNEGKANTGDQDDIYCIDILKSRSPDPRKEE